MWRGRDGRDGGRVQISLGSLGVDDDDVVDGGVPFGRNEKFRVTVTPHSRRDSLIVSLS